MKPGRKKGFKHSEEVREKMSLARIGKSPCNKGIKWSEEHKEKLRIAWKKRKENGNGIAWNKGLTGIQEAWNKGIHFIKIAGKNHPNWKGGITPENLKIRQSLEYKAWRNDIFERDNFLCQMPGCDKTERYLNAHHIKRFTDYSELRFDINNGITLCKICHNKTKRKEDNFIELFINIIKLKKENE